MVLVAALVMVVSPRPAAADDALCFDVSGITACIEGRFRQFWEQNGGLPIFGYPLMPAAHLPTGEGTFLTQYFERVRFEYHAENPPPYDVMLGRIGDDGLLAQGRDWRSFPAEPADAPHFFAVTGHAIAHEPFWAYWSGSGLHDPNLDPAARSLALFGMPISAPTMETNASGAIVLAQWFERARFEDHGPAGVLLGRLGDETRPSGAFEPAPVPSALVTPEPPQPPSPPSDGDKVVYLTFDDGPFPIWTRQILDLLAQYNARATFFVIGRQVPAYGDLIREGISMGSTFANHTYNHVALAGVSREQFQREVLATAEALGPYESRCLRPPYAVIDDNARAYAAELGYRVVLWEIDPYDWQRPGAAVIAARVLENIAPGKIVLLHDGGGERSQTVAALETILSSLTAQGYRFEPVCR